MFKQIFATLTEANFQGLLFKRNLAKGKVAIVSKAIIKAKKVTKMELSAMWSSSAIVLVWGKTNNKNKLVLTKSDKTPVV